MVLIPEFLPPRNDRLIINHYEIVSHDYPDEFHIVVYFVEKNKCKIIVRRMDSEDGWGQDLKIKIGDDIITIGPSNHNFISLIKPTTVNLTPREPQEQKIPKTIIQTYSSTRPQSLLHYNAVMSFIELNPDYSYYFYDNKKSRQFIKDNFPPRVLRAYDLLNPKAFKADLFRYCYIYKHGGCYFDHKFVCQTSLFKYIKPGDSNVFCKDMYEYGMFNAVFISVAQTNEMKATINQVVRNVEEQNYGRGVLDVTGPMLFDQFTNNQNVSLYHTDGRKIMHRGHQVLKTAFSGYYDKQVLRKENYGDLWVQRLVYYSNHHECNNYIIMTKPISIEHINEVRVALLTKGRLHRVKERIIQSSKQFIPLSIHFSFELNGNNLRIKRIDSNSGWDHNIIVTVINNDNSDSRDINIGTSSSNIKIISI